MAIIFLKYNPVYEVKLSDETIGYVESKAALEEVINNELLKSENPCAFFTSLDVEPTYELKLSNIKETNEDEIIQKLSENVTTMYRVYAVAINDEVKSYVDTFEEAQTIVTEMESEYSSSIDVTIKITEQYTENYEEIGTVELATAKSTIDTTLRQIKTEKEKIEASTFNGVYFSVTPVIGTITSRYGVVESSIRDHAHSGLDIAAPAGTNIKASSSGTVSYSGWMGGYGNLIIIDHENGVQSYYGHCSRLYASVGDEVEAGEVIAAVGSTGNSTGNHLHFEIRLNDSTINPQKYTYN